MISLQARSIAVSPTDIFFALWMLYAISRTLWVTQVLCDLYPYLFIIGCYAATRFFQRTPGILFGTIILVGLWQSSLGLLQQIGLVASNHPLYSVTGSFGNPGQLGGFLAVSIVCTLCIGLRSHKRNWWVLLPMLLAQGYILLLSDSRAGWLAAVGGCAFLILCDTTVLKRRVSASRLLKVMIYICVGACLAGLYFYKIPSANGRLLIWRVTTKMIADKPILGHGTGGFDREYMHYQADYFKSNPESSSIQYADNIKYPYNEFLHAWAEQGLVGVILLFALILSVLLAPAANRTYKGPLIAYLIFAQFSYPSYVPLLLGLFPVLLASIQSRPLFRVQSRVGLVMLFLMMICCFGYVGSEYLFRERCQTKLRELVSSSRSKAAEAERFVATHDRWILRYPKLADIYAQYAFTDYDPAHAISILDKVGSINPSCELYCDLGDLYSKSGKHEKALQCYQTAYHMIPRRVSPKYKLFLLYRERGDAASARRLGTEILSMPISIEGTHILRIKAEVHNYLSE